MNGKAWGAVCLTAGLSLSVAGWKLLKAQELPPGTTGFSGVTPNRRGLAIAAGYGLLVVGLILAALISSFFFIGG